MLSCVLTSVPNNVSARHTQQLLETSAEFEETLISSPRRTGSEDWHLARLEFVHFLSHANQLAGGCMQSGICYMHSSTINHLDAWLQ